MELEAVYVEPAGADAPGVVAARAAGVPVRDVLAGVLAKVLDLVTPQDVVAVARQRGAGLDELVAGAVASSRPVLVLVELQDPGNAGTLVRVAEAAGCAGVVLTERSVDVHNPKTVRASAGAVFRVPVAEGMSPAAVLEACAIAGLPTWATTGRGGTPVDGAPLAGACAVFLGSEAHGLPASVSDACTGRLTIPMEGRVESLNAGVAGALVAFEAARQRRVGEPSGQPSGSTGVPLGHNDGSLDPRADRTGPDRPPATDAEP